MSSAVLQIFVLREGRVLATEVFAEGLYRLGRAPDCDLVLPEPTVSKSHASLLFEDGRVTLTDDNSTTGTWVNGARINVAALRSADDVRIGTLFLKVRVLSKVVPIRRDLDAPEATLPVTSTALPPFVPRPPPAARPPAPPVARPPAAPPSAPRAPLPARVASAAPVMRPEASVASEPRSVPVPLPPRVLPPAPREAPAPILPFRAPVVPPAPEALDVLELVPLSDEPFEVVEVPVVRRQPRPTPLPPKSTEQASAVPPRPVSAPVPSVIVSEASVEPAPRVRPPPARIEKPSPPPAPAPRAAPSAPRKPAPTTKRPPSRWKDRLVARVLWGEQQIAVRAYRRGETISVGGKEGHPLPAYGFVDGTDLQIAKPMGKGWRVVVPPGTEVSVRASPNAAWVHASWLGADDERGLPVEPGAAIRLSRGLVHVEVERIEKPAAPRGRLLRFDPVFAFIFLCVAIAGWQLHRNLPEVRPHAQQEEPKQKQTDRFVRSIAKKIEPPKKAPEPKPAPRPKPKAIAEAKTLESAKESLQAVDKVASATESLGKLLSSLDKGEASIKGAGRKGLPGLPSLGNLPPIPGVGAGGGGGPLDGFGGLATRGRSALAGVAGLGSGTAGRGQVGGVPISVPKRPTRVQGQIDRDAVAAVINEHVGEMRGCYERALLRDPNVGGGKVSLEWTIAADGSVAEVRTKSSTLRNAAVVSCLLDLVRGLRFPKPQGGVVIVGYPILFDTVGY